MNLRGRRELNVSSKGSKEIIRKRAESGQNKILPLNKSDEKNFPSPLFRPFPLLLTLSSEYSNKRVSFQSIFRITLPCSLQHSYTYIIQFLAPVQIIRVFAFL